LESVRSLFYSTSRCFLAHDIKEWEKEEAEEEEKEEEEEEEEEEEGE